MFKKGDRVRLSSKGLIYHRDSKVFTEDRRGTIRGISKPIYPTRDYIWVIWDGNATATQTYKDHIVEDFKEQ